ncbi:MAG TPA: hypothetical protein ENI23_04015 [bacterium]|nr:hypothetical protein [bacterium]
MERHSVPQNIMDVEFKLFGSLTVRQFANLAAGILVGVLLYFFDIPGIIKWPLIVFSAFMGLALALFEINGQPFSRWLGNFIIAMFTTQRKVWKKNPKIPEILSKTYKPQSSQDSLLISKKKKLPPFLKEDLGKTVQAVDADEERRLNTLGNYLAAEKGKTAVKVAGNLTQQVVKKNNQPVVNPSKQNIAGGTNPVQDNIQPFEQSPNYTVTAQQLTQREQRPLNSKKMHKNRAQSLSSIMQPDSVSQGLQVQGNKYTAKELEESNKILQERIKKLSKNDKPGKRNSEVAKKLEDLQQTVENLGATQGFSGKKIIASKPNVVSGVVLDKVGAGLPNIRVLIKDKRGYLVRSLITDKEGQFITATALSKGEYVVEINSDSYTFDKYKIVLDGKSPKKYKFISR